MNNINNKGFSMIEILLTVSILGILLGIGLQAYDRYTKKARQQSYDTMAKSASLAMEEYIMDHPSATSVSFDELLEGNYINTISDPVSKDNCEGKVTLVNHEDASGNSLSTEGYSVNVCCTNYSYTYRFPESTKSKDRYCKAHPFSLEELKEKIDKIKVLNVYPYHSGHKVYGDHLQTWMNDYGKGIIEVDKVYIVDFNSNPEKYLGTSGNWKYDEVVFGFVDCNGSQDLSKKASDLVDSYLSSGGAAIFGHDTLTKNGCGNHTNFNSLAKYVNMDLNSGVLYKASNKVRIVRKGVFTEYPYKIGNVGTVLTIPTSHVYGQVAKGDIWITFEGTSDIDANKIYLSTWGNNAFIQTGHSDGAAKPDEQKIIANIIFYMVAKQYIDEV